MLQLMSLYPQPMHQQPGGVEYLSAAAAEARGVRDLTVGADRYLMLIADPELTMWWKEELTAAQARWELLTLYRGSSTS